jgi:hypothetical protein
MYFLPPKEHVPLKVTLFVWCFFRNRLPTKDNLLTRGIIQEETAVCVGGCGVQESVDHLLITCSHFGQLWMQIRSWLGLSSVDTHCAQDHFHQFGHLGGIPRQTHQFLKLIWLACAWTIWKERNNQIFNNKALSLHELLDQVKLLSFTWLKAKTINFAYTYHEWWRHHLSYMGIYL